MMLRLLLPTIAMSVCTSAALIHKRDEGLKCQSIEACVNWYTTGSAGCASGYTHTSQIVPGYPPSSYCERPCNESEKKQCAAGECTFYKGQCNMYPDSGICAKALVFCNAPVKTTKDNCVQLRMGQAVKYDDEAGTCAADPNAEADNHYVRIVVGKTGVDLNLYMTCAPVTAAGAASFASSITSKTRNCETADTSKYEIVWKCKEDKDKFKGYQDAARKACADAEYLGDAAPVFGTTIS